MAVPKLERLMNLVAALLHTTVPLSARQIRERVAGYAEGDVAFHRQFGRDKEDLREMGIPLRVEPVPDADPLVDGYRIEPDEYYLADPGLEPEELAALQLATRLVLGSEDSASAGLFKLGGMPGPAASDGPLRAPIPTPPALATVFGATGAGAAIAFDYRGRHRRIVPRRLAFRHGRWYVQGWDLAESEDRLYRLDRIDGEVEVDETPTGDVPDADVAIGSLEPWDLGIDEPVTAWIRVAASVRPSIERRFTRPQVDPDPTDGSAILTVETTSTDGFVSWILGFSDTVEVLGPPELRARVVAHLEELV